jgi:hypothetical protein
MIKYYLSIIKHSPSTNVDINPSKTVTFNPPNHAKNAQTAISGTEEPTLAMNAPSTAVKNAKLKNSTIS